jgi:hypothetical protein
VLAGLLQGRRRIKVEVADPALTPTARGFNHYKMAEFVELMILPLASTLESLRQAEQNRCKLIFGSDEALTAARKVCVRATLQVCLLAVTACSVA